MVRPSGPESTGSRECTLAARDAVERDLDLAEILALPLGVGVCVEL